MNNGLSVSFSATLKRRTIIMSHKHIRSPPGCCTGTLTILLCLQRTTQMLVFDTWIDVCPLLSLKLLLQHEKKRSLKKIRNPTKVTAWYYLRLNFGILSGQGLCPLYKVMVFIYSRNTYRVMQRYGLSIIESWSVFGTFIFFSCRYLR